jgi:hypothetical protein
VAPIIKAFNGSSGLSARAIGAEAIDVTVRNVTEAPAISAIVKKRRTWRLSLTGLPKGEGSLDCA